MTDKSKNTIGIDDSLDDKFVMQGWMKEETFRNGRLVSILYSRPYSPEEIRAMMEASAQGRMHGTFNGYMPGEYTPREQFRKKVARLFQLMPVFYLGKYK